jgi:hypothetical protein
MDGSMIPVIRLHEGEGTPAGLTASRVSADVLAQDSLVKGAHDRLRREGGQAGRLRHQSD